MEVHAKRDSASSWTTRRLFIMGLIGIIVAVCGFTWLSVGYANLLAQQNAQLERRAAQYDGNWHNIEGSWRIQTISISNNGVTLTVHIVDNQGNVGTGTVTFTGEPIAITVTVNDSYASYIVNITMILNNAAGTQLNVTDDTNPFTFEKAGI